MRKGTDLLDKLDILDGIPSDVDYDKIKDDGGWTLGLESESEEYGLEAEGFDLEFEAFKPEDRKTLQLLDLTININDYRFIEA